MSYALALGRSAEKRPAALLPLSGFMPVGGQLGEPRPHGLEGFPVAIAHGTLDPVIPVDSAALPATSSRPRGRTSPTTSRRSATRSDPQIIPALRGFVASHGRTLGSTPRVTPGGRWCIRGRRRSLVPWRIQRSRVPSITPRQRDVIVLIGCRLLQR